MPTHSPPALRFQSAANGSQREEGWGTVSRDKLLPKELDVEAKIQCAREAVRVSIHLPYDLGREGSHLLSGAAKRVVDPREALVTSNKRVS